MAANNLSPMTLPVLVITLLYSSHLVNCEQVNCTHVLDNNIMECSNCSQMENQCYKSCNSSGGSVNESCSSASNTTDDIMCLLVPCDSIMPTTMLMQSTETMTIVSTAAMILNLPRTVFIIIVACCVGGALLLLLLLLCLCCCCCYCCRRKKRRLENLKLKLIEQPEVDKSPSRQSGGAVSPAQEPVKPAQPVDDIKMQINEALRHNSSPQMPSSSVTELLPLNMSSSSCPKSKSTENFMETNLSDPAMRPKTGSDAYLKMNPTGSVRPSKSCHDFVEEEEIYVEPDQNLHQSCDAVSPTKSNTVPKKPKQPKPPVAQKPENVYGNQETIDKQSKESAENEGYENVVPPTDDTGESYTSVSEFLHGHKPERNIEDDEDVREYYNYIPGVDQDDEMYVYMQSGIAGTKGHPPSDLDRLRKQGKTSSSIKYMNLSAQDQLNRRLPGSDYGEAGDGNNVTMTNGTDSGGDQPIYANCSDEEELYTEMS